MSEQFQSGPSPLRWKDRIEESSSAVENPFKIEKRQRLYLWVVGIGSIFGVSPTLATLLLRTVIDYRGYVSDDERIGVYIPLYCLAFLSTFYLAYRNQMLDPHEDRVVGLIRPLVATCLSLIIQYGFLVMMVLITASRWP
jgi:hypothetical protein